MDFLYLGSYCITLELIDKNGSTHKLSARKEITPDLIINETLMIPTSWYTLKCSSPSLNIRDLAIIKLYFHFIDSVNCISHYHKIIESVIDEPCNKKRKDVHTEFTNGPLEIILNTNICIDKVIVFLDHYIVKEALVTIPAMKIGKDFYFSFK